MNLWSREILRPHAGVDERQMNADRERYRRDFEALGACPPDHSVTKALAFIPPESSVLEFGCNTGFVSKLLVARGCTVIGVELDRWAADQARESCQEVVVGDVSTMDLREALKDRKFDVALFGDVIEHIADPQPVLEGVKGLLRANGFIVISVPNIAHWSVRLGLLQGKFEYGPTGILDETHLRHYTLKSLQDLLHRSGYDAVGIDGVRQRFTKRIARGCLRGIPFWGRRYLYSVLSQDDAAIFQYIVKARPSRSLSAPTGERA
ncbi:MAG: class I SAM-dependent methyltransferase [Acidobacteriota bacterium]